MILPKVLILTGNYGNGHLQVAHSLEQELTSMGVSRVLVKDLFYETSPRIHEWTRRAYLKSYTKGGQHIYRLFYYTSKEISKRKNLKLLSYGYSKLKKIIAEEQPDLIVNTFPSFAVPHYHHKTNTKIPTYNVITDYCIHDLWIHPNINKYYVATKQIEQDLWDRGIEPNRTLVTGIPIHQSFEESYQRRVLVQKYGLVENRKTILIVAGAYGVSKEMAQICDLLKNDPLLQIIVVCGKNQELFDDLTIKYNGLSHIKILGYVTEMAELLTIATCVVTKPGGLILSEAMAMKTPILIPKATPGQEKENAMFFSKVGGAIWSQKTEELAKLTKQLVRNESKLQEMQETLEQLQAPRSSSKLVTDILQDYYSQTMTKLKKA
ncbi:MGDG synthase family glycosyltransferase [Bacillus alkalicellulosilyticus]|uniref:MGDG synthase family glycosyltransferase n=1 Tax=Alkalihalobacterium alkalicellulosilyticum TaxID=1912214 RepID=UPI000997D849|nr:glycosyltransferase [Bacillus alkalicellulosilyticus]